MSNALPPYVQKVLPLKQALGIDKDRTAKPDQIDVLNRMLAKGYVPLHLYKMMIPANGKAVATEAVCIIFALAAERPAEQAAKESERDSLPEPEVINAPAT